MSFPHNEYIPVDERRRQALKKMEKLRQAGEDIHPIIDITRSVMANWI